MGSMERSDARLNRERILRAAADVISEKGVGAEVKEIAERAGVGIGTIYRNFPTKDDLVIAIVSDMLDETEAALETTGAEGEPAESIAAYIRAVFGLMPKFTPIMMAMLSGSVTQEMKARLVELMLDEKLRRIIQRGVESGSFRKDLDVDIATAFVANTFHPMVFLALQGKMDVPAMAEGYVDLVLRALRGQG